MTISGVSLDDVFTKGDEIFKVAGITDQPTVTLRNVKSGEDIHLVIGSALYNEFKHLVEKPK